MSVKHTVVDEAAVERTHPTFFPLLEQWEQHAQAIQSLRVGEAFVRLPNDTVRRVKTPSLPDVRSPQSNSLQCGRTTCSSISGLYQHQAKYDAAH